MKRIILFNILIFLKDFILALDSFGMGNIGMRNFLTLTILLEIDYFLSFKDIIY